jgi:muconolactone delta-isomerase
MKILALEHELPNVMAEQFQQHAKAEARRVWELYQAGILRESYFRADRNEAALVLECASMAEAQEILSTLPFIQNNLITFEIIPLKAYPGFERLFVIA